MSLSLRFGGMRIGEQVAHGARLVGEEGEARHSLRLPRGDLGGDPLVLVEHLEGGGAAGQLGGDDGDVGGGSGFTVYVVAPGHSAGGGTVSCRGGAAGYDRVPAARAGPGREGAGAVSGQVFVDETKHRDYLMVAAVLRPVDVAVLRRVVRGLVLPRQRRVHVSKESEPRRKMIADTTRAAGSPQPSSTPAGLTHTSSTHGKRTYGR